MKALADFGITVCVVSATLLTTAANADEWLPPTTQAYLSSDKAWRLTVTPRAIASPLAYFNDMVAKRKNAGALPGSPQKHAEGLMERLDQGQWRVAWRKPLLNDVSPVDAVVSESGQAVTFDNWHSVGYGSDAVVIYDAHGKVVRAMGLKEFLPEEYFEALPRSVSSIWWGRGHFFSADGKQVVLRVVVPSMEASSAAGDRDPKYIELAFDLATGRAIPPDSKAWSDALAAAAQVSASNRAAIAKWEAEFIAPLTGPNSDEDVDWHRYLDEAFFRVDPQWKDNYPATKVLRLPERQDYVASVGYISNEFRDKLDRESVVMIASPSQDNLVRVLSELAANVPHGGLKKVRIYVAVDDAHTAAAAIALAPTGAEYIQLDPTKPIPQRKARLDAYRDGKRKD